MQSVTGEMAFGGRSNQYLFNEAYLASACAYEAARYAKEGDPALAGQFALAMTEDLPEWQETAELLSRREEKLRRRRGVKRKNLDSIDSRRM